ncbi:uncharacterized mitochondrial protein AtMg00810-like [Arachis hypogaea]|uniref:uncharacterized mitochondrial protein AtMg00810-like n=1 Tax=Arachis hypogaea TaxID=3818 RepID=UPI003B212F89
MLKLSYSSTINSETSSFGGSNFNDPQLYRSIIGSLQYLTVTSPKISYSIYKMSQFVQAPLDVHLKMVKRILRYLKGTTNHDLLLKKANSMEITTYSDLDWDRNPDDRKFTSGYCVFLGSNMVLWASRKQTTVAKSSIEAEYRSMVGLVAELIW